MNDRPQAVQETANDDFKKTYGNWVAAGLIGAVAAHFALFVLVPQFRAADLGMAGDEMEAVTLPPEVRIPPPPEQIARPATPRVAEVDVSEDVTIAPTTFETNPVENLPPPPSGGSPSDRPSFIPYDTPPRLQNPGAVQQALQRYYPQSLKNAGVGGRIVLWVYVDESGQVTNSQVKESSGHSALDEAAKRVAAQMEFSPAMNRDKRTAVWVAQPITFEVRG